MLFQNINLGWKTNVDHKAYNYLAYPQADSSKVHLLNYCTSLHFSRICSLLDCDVGGRLVTFTSLHFSP